MDELSVTYQRRQRGGKTSISLTGRGEVIVRFPRRVPLLLAKLFFKKHKSIVEEMKIRQMRAKEKLALEYALDERLFFTHSGTELSTYKEHALALVLPLTQSLAVPHIAQYKKVTIKNTKSRWGSCSSKGNLNFHYKILFLPTVLAKYLIIHELCHLKEMNHSKNFWELVASLCPDYQKLRKDLQSFSP